MCWAIQFQDNLKSLWLSLHHSSKITGEHLDQIANAIEGTEDTIETSPVTTLEKLGVILSKTTVEDNDLVKLLGAIKKCVNLKDLKLYIDDTNITEETIVNI